MKTEIVTQWPGGADIRPANHDSATRIDDQIWLSPGLSNSYMVQTEDGRVIINTGMGFEAPIHKRVYDQVDDAPVRYIVLTQGHVDHVGGVDFIREPGTLVMAHQANQRCQADDNRIGPFRIRRSFPFWSEAIEAAGQTGSAGSTGGPELTQSRPIPDRTFADTLAFEVGNTQFELHSTPGGETVDSLVVWLPQRRILFSGNLFSALFGHFPNLTTMRGDRMRDPLVFVESCNTVLALEPETLCVGHFGPLRGSKAIRSEIIRIRDAVLFVHDAVVAGMNKGADLHTLMRDVQLPGHLDVGEGYGKVSWAVRSIWETYAGWFLAQSTRELYGVPDTATHQDLVALAGADNLSARAQELIVDNQPERALHLAEVVLTADPEHIGAWTASRDAHRQLLDRAAGENFWETRWLQIQLQKAERKILAAKEH